MAASPIVKPFAASAGFGWLARAVRALQRPWPRTRPSSAVAPAKCLRLVHLGPGDRDEMLGHLLRLDADGRARRFMGGVDSAFIARYVAGVEFARDVVIGAREGSALIGLVHAPFPANEEGRTVEVAVSVLPGHRGVGIGTRLLRAAQRSARARGVGSLQLRYFATNTPIAAWVRGAGGTVVRAAGECVADVPTLDTPRIRSIAPASSRRSRLAEAIGARQVGRARGCGEAA